MRGLALENILGKRIDSDTLMAQVDCYLFRKIKEF